MFINCMHTGQCSGQCQGLGARHEPLQTMRACSSTNRGGGLLDTRWGQPRSVMLSTSAACSEADSKQPLGGLPAVQSSTGFTQSACLQGHEAPHTLLPTLVTVGLSCCHDNNLHRLAIMLFNMFAWLLLIRFDVCPQHNGSCHAIALFTGCC